jgi:lipopolysaccharide exporter
MIQQTVIDTTDEVEELLVEEALTEEQIRDIKTKSVSGVMSYFLRTAFLQGIGLISAFILSAFLSLEDFGIYGFVTQIIGLLIFFSDVGLAASLIQKKKKPTLEDYRTAFTIQQILSWLIVGIILIVVRTGVVQQKVGTTGIWILLALAFSFPLASLKTISSIKLERDLDFSKLVIPQIFEQLVFHGTLIFLAYRQFGAMAYTWAILLRSIVGTIVMWVIKPWKISFLIDKNSLRGLLKYGLKFQANDLLARIKDQLYFLALGMFFPLRQFGIIQWSKNWSMYPYNLTVQSVMAITFPTFSRLQDRKDLLKKAIEKSLFFISASIFPILAIMSVFIFPLTQVVEKYHKWQPARLSFVLFTLSIAWAALSTPLVNTLNAIGQINQSLKLMILWTILTWILTPILIYFMGFNGVAASAFLISFTSVLSIKFVNKVVRIDVWGSINKQLLAAIVMAGVGIIGINYWSESLTKMLLGILIVSLVYLGSFFIIAKDKLINELKSFKK